MENRIIQTPLVLLAGGQSSRMGEPKGLLRFGKRRWIEEQLHRFSFCGNKAVVVLGYDHEKYLDAIPAFQDALQLWAPWPLPHREELQLSVTVNQKPENGPFSSLGRGLNRLLPDSDAFILPVDVPVAVPEVWRLLETRGRQRKLSACIPEHQGKRGHPVWLSSRFAAHLRTLAPESPDSRLDQQIAALAQPLRDTIEVTDPKVTWNMNTPQEFADIKQRLSKEFVP
ncbi:MAG: hypothetical protein A2X94_08270 [Bdellovibrionales bacterium GWB1_55_8]|nr:MAG: hypothetical protein A2X94_08270 [Bdellovibrionales bacterium GWB1_55_8]